jgi:RNA polymerase sigma-70 factor (ECF subfamily)
VDVVITQAELDNTREQYETGTVGPSAESQNVLQRVFASAADGLYRFILVRSGGDRSTAEDLLQQTCCVAAGHERVPRRAAKCEAWLFGIARNLIREHWRKNARSARSVTMHNADLSRKLLDQMESGPLPEEVLRDRESAEQLLRAVTAMSAADQHLIFAFYFQGRSQTDIAAEVGTSSRGVETRLYRARRRLKDALRATE